MSNLKIWERDLPLILKKVYKEAGAKFPAQQPLHSLLDLIEWLLRVPFQYPRNVYKSRELQNKILTPFEIRGLTEIEKLTRTGGNLKPYLGDTTRLIRNRASKRNDFFFSDWGLLHFHLGADFENKGIKVSGTKRVLIARFENQNAYFIDVVNHCEGYANVWTDTTHLKIIYKNWSKLFGKPMRASDKSDKVFTESDYFKFRKNKIKVPVLIDEKLFSALGFGMTTDGGSLEATFIADGIIMELNGIENEFRKTEETTNVCLAINKKDFSIGFLNLETRVFYSYYKLSHENEVTRFFHRLLSEIPLSTSQGYHGFILPDA